MHINLHIFEFYARLLFKCDAESQQIGDFRSDFSLLWSGKRNHYEDCYLAYDRFIQFSDNNMFFCHLLKIYVDLLAAWCVPLYFRFAALIRFQLDFFAVQNTSGCGFSVNIDQNDKNCFIVCEQFLWIFFHEQNKWPLYELSIVISINRKLEKSIKKCSRAKRVIHLIDLNISYVPIVLFVFRREPFYWFRMFDFDWNSSSICWMHN